MDAQPAEHDRGLALPLEPDATHEPRPQRIEQES
jgi:hypothetical protein